MTPDTHCLDCGCETNGQPCVICTALSRLLSVVRHERKHRGEARHYERPETPNVEERNLLEPMYRGQHNDP